MTEFGTLSLDDDGPSADDAEDIGVAQASDAARETKPRKLKLTAFANQLRKAAEMYATLRNAEFDSNRLNRHVGNLERIQAFQAYTLLLDMFLRGLGEKCELRILRALEAFMMRRHICEKRTNELETIFAALTAESDSNFEAAVLRRLREHTPDDQEFEASFAAFPFVANVIDRARYALEMIEYRTIDTKDEYYLADPDDLELEHIIPKAVDSAAVRNRLGDWTAYLGDGWQAKHKKYLHRIGNMTLLADELNVVASNNPFHSKRIEYGKSNIRLSKDLVKLPQFRFNTVEIRSKALASQAVKIWVV